MGSATDIFGRKIRVVEDDSLIAWEFEAILGDAGCIVVGPFCDLPGALAAIQGAALDGALLDVNLGDHSIAPAADALNEARVPFGFVTGYGEDRLPPRHRARPMVPKPFHADALVAALGQAMANDAMASDTAAK